MNIPKLLDEELDGEIEAINLKRQKLLTEFSNLTKEVSRLAAMRDIHLAMKEPSNVEKD